MSNSSLPVNTAATPALDISLAVSYVTTQFLPFCPRFSYRLNVLGCTRSSVFLTSDWSFNPSPLEPNPSPRCSIEFRLDFHQQLKTPTILYYRLSSTQLWNLYTKCPNFTLFIENNIKLKYKIISQEFCMNSLNNSLTNQEKEYFNGRLLNNNNNNTNNVNNNNNNNNSLEIHNPIELVRISSIVSNTNSILSIEKEIIHMFLLADQNHDGLLDWNEYLEYIFQSEQQQYIGLNKSSINSVAIKRIKQEFDRICELNRNGNDNKISLNYKESFPLLFDLYWVSHQISYVQRLSRENRNKNRERIKAAFHNNNNNNNSGNNGNNNNNHHNGNGKEFSQRVESKFQSTDYIKINGEFREFLLELGFFNAAEVEQFIKVAQRHQSPGGLTISLKGVIREFELLSLDTLEIIELPWMDISTQIEIELSLEDREKISELEPEYFYSALLKDSRFQLSPIAICSILNFLDHSTHESNNNSSSSSSSQQNHHHSGGLLNYSQFSQRAGLFLECPEFQLSNRIRIYQELLNRSNLLPIEVYNTQQLNLIQSQFYERFRESDFDGDSALNSNEFLHFMCSLGIPMDRIYIESIWFPLADRNSDGKIDLNEFQRFLNDILLKTVREGATKNQTFKGILVVG